MSRRVLQQDVNEHRVECYKKITRSALDEAWGEMAERLSAQGIDIGPKAEAIVAKRTQIKKGVPKP